MAPEHAVIAEDLLADVRRHIGEDWRPREMSVIESRWVPTPGTANSDNNSGLSVLP
ncbi:hypothetical protein NKDENANG_00100 [Candidatus Entotheonellaceae bacterium PAL068K]